MYLAESPAFTNIKKSPEFEKRVKRYRGNSALFYWTDASEKRINCKGGPYRQESSLIDNMPVINMDVEGDS